MCGIGIGIGVRMAHGGVTGEMAQMARRKRMLRTCWRVVRGSAGSAKVAASDE